MNFLANNIKYLRNQKKLTQLELANILGLTSHGAIMRIETNRGLPSLEIADQLSKYFNVSIDDLLYKDLSKSV